MIIGRQLFRSATSVAANYRAACRSRSDAEFYNKISIVLEESDETLFWLEFLVEGEIVGKNRLDGLMKECEEIVKIVNSIRTNKRKDKLAQQTSILNLKTLTQK
jgi:four helix bundle protein